MPATDVDRCAFDEFLETMRLEVFRMYEDLREVKRDGSVPWCERLARLNAVGAGAQQVWSSISTLNAAVWYGGETMAVASFDANSVATRSQAHLRKDTTIAIAGSIR